MNEKINLTKPRPTEIRNSDGTFSIGKTLIIYLGTAFFIIAGVIYAVVNAGNPPVKKATPLTVTNPTQR